MKKLPDYSLKKLPKDTAEALNNLQQKAGSSGTVWGTGRDGRVYLWNGRSWDEPNPAARLKYVETGTLGPGVWGVGADQRVYNWNGSSWDEPNPYAGLYSISAFNSNIAVGVGWKGRLYITWNGGLHWERFFPSHENFSKVSVGHLSQNFFWGVKDFPQHTKLWHFNGSSLETITTPFEVQDMSATTGSDGVWAVDLDKKIHKWDGHSWYQPNPEAGLYYIDCTGGYDEAWGIGYNDRIFKTVDSGASWSEPNPEAKLFHLSAN